MNRKFVLSALLSVGLVVEGTNKCFATEVGKTSEQEAAASEDNNGFSGFFVGGGVGFDFCSVELRGDDVSHKFSPKPFGAVLVAGFGQTLENRVYIGGELDFGVKNPAEDSKSEEEAKLTVKIRTLSIGGSLRLGYYFDNAPTLLYGLIGLENHGASSECFEANKKTRLSNSESESFTPFRIGMGCSYKFGDNWSARGDVLYVFKKEKKNKIEEDYEITIGTSKFEIRAMMIYNF
ncbi:MAG: outer membrane beta-barrel protein [Holosporales bacterium]|jgi:opacity protein-like surface antigen|nr:outer membrane beta-barrel protein [Holosporales bacterium]